MKKAVCLIGIFGCLSAFAGGKYSGNLERCDNQNGQKYQLGIAAQFGLPDHQIRCASDVEVAQMYDSNLVWNSAQFVYYVNDQAIEISQSGGHQIVIPANSLLAIPLKQPVHPYVNILADYRRPIQAASFELFGKKDLVATSAEGGVLLALSIDYSGTADPKVRGIVNSFGLNSPFTTVNGKYGYSQKLYRVQGADWDAHLTWLYTDPDVDGYSIEQMGK